MDEGSRAILLGKAACLDTLHGVWVGDGGRVAGSPSTDASGEFKVWEKELENHGS